MTDAEPTITTSVARGVLGCCPACGKGRLFGRFLKVEPACTSCGQAFVHHRADDFPPYIVIFIVAHVVGYGIYLSESHLELSLLVQGVIWPALAIALSLALIQPAKGGVIGLQYALRMHGFGERAKAREGERADDRGTRGAPQERVPGR